MTPEQLDDVGALKLINNLGTCKKHVAVRISDWTDVQWTTVRDTESLVRSLRREEWFVLPSQHQHQHQHQHRKHNYRLCKI
jgi:hypothetical protein